MEDSLPLCMCWKKTTGTQTFIYNARSLWNEVSANILSQCLCSRSGPIYLVWQIVTPSLRSILYPTFFIHFISLPAACMSLSYHPTLLLLRNINIATVWVNLTYMNIFFIDFTLNSSWAALKQVLHAVILTCYSDQQDGNAPSRSFHAHRAAPPWKVQGKDDVRLQQPLILGLNASCLTETHKSSSLSQTIPSKAYSLSLVMGSLY